MAYRNRKAGKKDSAEAPKARTVTRGYKVDDNVKADGTPMKRESPTVSRLGFLVIQMLASLHLRLFGADASCAFMQGVSYEIDDRNLYMRQPPEGLPGLLKGQLLRISMGNFGLLDAPHRWWLHLRRISLGLGFKQLSLDRAIFVCYAGGQIAVIIAVHVDDIIGGHSRLDSLKEAR